MGTDALLGCATEMGRVLGTQCLRPSCVWVHHRQLISAVTLFVHVFYADLIAVLGEEMILYFGAGAAQQLLSDFASRFATRE